MPGCRVKKDDRARRNQERFGLIGLLLMEVSGNGVIVRAGDQAMCAFHYLQRAIFESFNWAEKHSDFE